MRSFSVSHDSESPLTFLTHDFHWCLEVRHESRSACSAYLPRSRPSPSITNIKKMITNKAALVGVISFNQGTAGKGVW